MYCAFYGAHGERTSKTHENGTAQVEFSLWAKEKIEKQSAAKEENDR